MNLDFTLYPKQHAFVDSKKRYVSFIGGRGSGKTRALCIKILIKALNNPGSLGCLTGPTYAMLREATKRTFLEICPPSLIVYRNDSDNLISLATPSGKVSELLFRSTSDPDSLRGLNLLYAGMDEAAMENNKEPFLVLLGTLRSRPSEEQQMIICSTPKGMNWVYEEFGPSRLGENDRDIFYASSDENIFLSPEYINDLKRQYTGAFYQQEFDAKFVAHEGQVYGDLWKYDKHIGNYPFNPTLNVDLFWDFGYPKPEAVGAIQQDARGNVFLIDEIYRVSTPTETIAAEVKSKPWFKNVVDCVADEARPDMIKRLQALGIPARPSFKGKILDGINKCRSLLLPDSITNDYIFHVDKRCEMFIKEMDNYRWKDKRRDSDEWTPIPVDAQNHLMDGWRYWTIEKWNPKSKVVVTRKRIPKRIMSYQLM